MARIAILTPDVAHPYHGSRWPEVLERMAAPIRRNGGHSIAARSWTEADDLHAFDLVLPLLAWGYPQAHDLWLERARRWEEERVNIRNPASVLRWDSDKSYLGDLAERGAPIVPTLYFDRLTLGAMEEARERFGTDRLVAKPRISSGAWQTIRWRRDSTLEGGPEGAAMVQPYLPEIERSGEVSLIYFGGGFSHAIRKVPQPGDFRVQPEYDGVITRYEPQADEVEAAERVLAAVAEDLLYARVDLVPGLGGSPELIELELIEPDLYLQYDPENGRYFTEAVMELIGR
jgi:glutathione synthase/RimK-type ligase-like ATP-grasp enzyme